MKTSQFKNYSDLPLFLNAETVAKTLGVAPSSAYELMHESDFPVLKIGNRIVVPKDKFILWVEQHIQGGAYTESNLPPARRISTSPPEKIRQSAGGVCQQ